MYDHILIRYGEIGLKGKNQMRFIKKLIKDLKFKVKREYGDKVQTSFEKGRIFISLNGDSPEKYYSILKKVFGIVSFSPVIKTGTNFDEISETIMNEIESLEILPSTFKVVTRRADKNYPMKSPEISREIGAHVLRRFPEIKVDIHNPEMEIFVEIRQDFSYIYTKKEQGAGGMPVNSAGRGLLLLSGGIDSPVAGYLAARKGIELSGIHFFSYPYTSQRARDKVVELSKILSEYKGNFYVHMVPFTEIQEEIAKKCEESYWITIMRRFMFRISERVAADNECLALVTGESVGQVASQTLYSMATINQVINIPVLRPLVTMDKEEIIKIAKEIGTYETSIEPYEDCCTAFLPREPKTKPQIFLAEEYEEALDIEGLVERAVKNIEVLKITGDQENDLGLF
ncbi:MAG: tRNA 4-thiouridine(8) synthase ThiI [Eubacteriales bacterium]|nr:tRNA 4-thiouridine(8) synthase ThiI [Eubacteriales bacterium]